MRKSKKWYANRRYRTIIRGALLTAALVAVTLGGRKLFKPVMKKPNRRKEVQTGDTVKIKLVKPQKRIIIT